MLAFGMVSKLRRILIIVSAAVGVVLVAAATITFLFGRTSSPILPNPNGYDDLLKAGELVVGKLDEISDLDHDGIRALLSTNAEPLRLLRIGCECQVPTETTITNFTGVMTDLINLKALAKLLLAEGRLAEKENRFGDAARSYVDAIHIGVEMSRGGLMINRLVGIACEAMGAKPLTTLIPKLGCDQIQPIISNLEQIETNTVTWNEVVINENRFARAQMGIYPNPIKLVSELWQARTTRQQAHLRHDLAAAHFRLIIVELTLRCYQSEQGHAPTQLTELIPRYLQRVPLDPFSNSPLVYRSQGTNWLLYSLVPDRVDDGGKPIDRIISGDYLVGFGNSGAVSRERKKGDLFYDSPW
jgi:hypothetical protein